MIVEAVSSFLGAFGGSWAFHYAHRRVVTKLAAQGKIEMHSEERQCTHCRSRVYRYELLPNDHVMCANCIRERG